MKPVLLYGLLAALFLCLGSCKNADDEFLPDDVLPPVPEGYVRMQITVPSLTPVSTYALSSVDETHVSEVDVLVFGSDSKYLCHAAVVEPSKITDTGSTKTFDVDLRGAGNITSAYVMVVANASVDTTGFAASQPTKEAVMQSMTFSSSGKWNVTGNSNFKPFPMWGMTATPVSLAGTSSISSISLLRSVARIDVGIKFPDNVTNGTETAAGLGSTFTLEEIYLYNSLDKGSVAPYSSSYSGTTVTAPSIPDSPSAPGVNNSPVPSYLSSNGAADGFSANKFSCTGAIYMAEHAAGDRNALSDNPYLVIGGKYNGSGTVTYYRLDFVSGNYPDQEFLPVLRNHRYRFNITGVAGPGYTSADLAAAARPVNLTYDLSATDESLASYVYDGQYALGVSQDEYVLDRASTENAYKKNNTLKVSATYANYTIAVAQTGNWLTMTDGTGTFSNTVIDHTFTVTENSGSSDRTATITVTSGRLEKKITVRQRGAGFEVSGFLASYPASGNVVTPPKVKSSYPWSVNVKSDPDAIIQTFTASGTGTGSDETFTFTLKNNTSKYTGSISTAILEFFSPTGEFVPAEQIIKLPGGQSAYIPTAHKGWAGSNIYWDISRNCLTFDDTPDNNPTGDATGHEGYQGVFFKWGSLVGTDPMRSTGSGSTWSSDNWVYVPNYNSASPNLSIWNRTSGYTWDMINYADASIIGNETLPERARLYEITTPANISNHRGDICRYLTETGTAPGADKGTRWRMPVSNEYSGIASDYPIKPASNTDWPDYSDSFTGNAYGTWTVVNASSIVVGRRKTNEPSGAYQPFFPASGSRNTNDGELRLVGNEGIYWSASPGGNTSAYFLFFNSGPVSLNNYDRILARSVRCVKE
ncbi:MAG: hypothetical protein LBR26_16970 [Prevotella sp.]|jgi:hypothetical protein|nr:hypothetical protein [Prevotella sp.]